MLRSLLKAISPNSDVPGTPKQRRHERRDTECCVLKIGGQMYPVQNWSMGGAFITANSQFFNLGDLEDCVMQFRLSDDIAHIPVNARIVRKTGQGVAIEFNKVNSNLKKQLKDIAAA